ncbi:glycosyl transferase family protein [Parablastomonas sp. CN1-191]|uniref:glycosyl transferase family protein n=1 Tax=Parablastomonas sp. CN1-191 TaxID=3400908 RepID=UPI003BF825E3
MLSWLQLAERELLMFAAFWFTIGLVDEFAIDALWAVLRLRGRIVTGRLPDGYGQAPLGQRMAVFLPAWGEAAIIATTVSAILQRWQQEELRLYVGVYRNDAATLDAAMAAARGDPRARIAVLDGCGPSTKADCLNRLYSALEGDEHREGAAFGAVVLQDAEDLVHPAGLQLLAEALHEVDFAQLPVRAEPVPGSRWIAGHYIDEFAESHAKALPVRGALGAGLPAAGVGCGFSRAALGRLAAARPQGPFHAASLTEDYELGLLLSRGGRGSRFLRMRDADGTLVATRSCFPPTFEAAVRQKSRWIHGIALQGWDHLGWLSAPVDLWMMLRDRRGPLTALVLVSAYLLAAVELVLVAAHALGMQGAAPEAPLVRYLAWLSMSAFAWRAGVRAISTTHEYGLGEGLLAVPRIVVSNVVAIAAARRALGAYLRSLRGAAVRWEKTVHDAHPARMVQGPA